MEKKKRWRIYLLLIISITVFWGSGSMLLCRWTVQKKNEHRMDELARLLVNPAKETENAEDKGEREEPKTNPVLTKQADREARVLAYREIRKQNEDVIGWIKIEDTRIDYPVLQTPDKPDFYLSHDFDKQPSRYGVPYAAEECNLQEGCSNIIVYGHHMKNGSMFASLNGYLDKEFWKEHSLIQFDTLKEYGDYQVMAVLTVSAADEEHPLLKWIWAENQENFECYVSYIKKQSIYDTGIAAQWEDQLLSLITCEYTQQDGRLIVVAKRVKDGEEIFKAQKKHEKSWKLLDKIQKKCI